MAARMKRMTLTYSAKGKQQPPGNTIPNYGLTGILGTGGIKATGLRKKRRNHLLIKPDYKEQAALEHGDMPINRKAFVSSRTTSGYNISADSRRAITLTSTAAIPKRLCLKNSRRYRLTRLRTTAHPIFLLAVMPSRAVCRLFSPHTTRKPRTAVLCCAEES